MAEAELMKDGIEAKCLHQAMALLAPYGGIVNKERRSGIPVVLAKNLD